MSNSRALIVVPIRDAGILISHLPNYYRGEQFFTLLDSNDHVQSDYRGLCGIGSIDHIKATTGSALEELEDFRHQYQDWMFGYLGYDLKNELESLNSNNEDLLVFPDLYFYVPKLVLEIRAHEVIFHGYDIDESHCKDLLEDILKSTIKTREDFEEQNDLKSRDSYKEYIRKAKAVLAHIQRGDIYEANLCTQFYAQDVILDPVKAYSDLNKSSAPPFAAYLKMESVYILSASPERYLKKVNNTLISQPIKGTAKRYKDKARDLQSKNQLLKDQKELSENVMIVDLVRNDLSKIALKGTVNVSELFGLHTFPQVHHMISTIQAKIANDRDLKEIIMATFPMGSMTGAPKISAMKIIEQQESFKRGVYSGAVGYIKPNGDFDFNVVIRTILYNEDRRVVSISVGSAITAGAIPHKEYEECQLKAAALKDVLKSQGI